MFRETSGVNNHQPRNARRLQVDDASYIIIIVIITGGRCIAKNGRASGAIDDHCSGKNIRTVKAPTSVTGLIASDLS